MKLKKIGFLLIFVIITIIPINADATYDFSLQFANIRSGLYFNNGKYNFSELSAELFNFYFENDRKLSFILSPLNISSNFEMTDETDGYIFSELSFLNINLYWNLWGVDEIVLGPFASLQYLSLIDFHRFDFKNITLNAGIKFMYKSDTYNFIGTNYAVGMEIGYKYNYFNRHGIYVAMMIDMFQMLDMIVKFGKFLDFLWNPTVKIVA